MLTTSAFAGIGALVGDPARANMLVSLMDGRALTARELAALAGVTPQTASSHLAQLVAGGLLAVERQGRHRYHRLAGPEIARMIEGMMTVAAGTMAGRRASSRTGPQDQALCQARTCYDHLAGRVAVAIADRMVVRGEIELGADSAALTRTGARFLREMGIDLDPEGARGGRKRVFCRPCLDWSERRPHVAGLVGAALLDYLLAKSWVRRTASSRAVVVTPTGQRHLTALFDLDPALWRPPSL